MGKIILSLFVFLIVFALNILLSANNLSTFLLLLGFESLVMLILFFLYTYILSLKRDEGEEEMEYEENFTE